MPRTVGAVITRDFDVAGGATNQAPTDDTAITVGRGATIVIQADSATRTDNASTNVDVNVHASLDGSTFDTNPWASITALGNDEIECLSVTPGVASIKLRLDNNDGAHDAYIRCRVLTIAE